MERAPYAEAFADLMRGGIRSNEYSQFVKGVATHDVSADLTNVRAKTLVLTREQAAAYTPAVVGEVAAGIPNAEFVYTPGNWLMPCTGDDITREIARFMNVSDPQHLGPGQSDLARALAGRSDDGHASKLSQREREVLELVAQGMTNSEIAQELVVAHATASRHVHNILNKLGMSRRAELAAYAAVSGLLAKGRNDYGQP